MTSLRINGYSVASRVFLAGSKPDAGGHTFFFLPWHTTQFATMGDWGSLPRLALWGLLGGTDMSNTVHLSDVQLLNLSALMTIQASIKKDPVAACFKFNLSVAQAQRVEGLGQQQLQAIVANRAEESLFKLRDDFWPLLDAPLGLQVPLSTVRFAGALATVVATKSMPQRESA